MIILIISIFHSAKSPHMNIISRVNRNSISESALIKNIPFISVSSLLPYVLIKSNYSGLNGLTTSEKEAY